MVTSNDLRATDLRQVGPSIMELPSEPQELPVAQPMRASSTNNRSKVSVYWQYTKPRIWMLFTVEGFAGAMLAWNHTGPFPLVRAIGVVAMVALGAIGAEAFTNVIDRDMDARMERTKSRPLPAHLIKPGEALLFGSAAITGSLIMAGLLGAVPFLFIAIGLLDNIIIYSLLSKRATPWSIVLGSISGGVPVWAGYAAIRLPISPGAWLLGALVMTWIPLHIWSIAYAYSGDYAKAGVPMAPVVWSQRQFGLALSTAAVIMFGVAVMGDAFVWRGGTAEILVADLAAATIVGAAMKFALRPSVHRGKQVFMVCNVYLLLLFIGIIAMAGIPK
ncbi:MAG: UbiA family prenyltransferase [Actinobacteria bacterium]|nr:UbiA family prenyltransferase [Actinomycetota bacterium]